MWHAVYVFSDEGCHAQKFCLAFDMSCELLFSPSSIAVDVFNVAGKTVNCHLGGKTYRVPFSRLRSGFGKGKRTHIL